MKMHQIGLLVSGIAAIGLAQASTITGRSVTAADYNPLWVDSGVKTTISSDINIFAMDSDGLSEGSVFGSVDGHFVLKSDIYDTVANTQSAGSLSNTSSYAWQDTFTNSSGSTSNANFDFEILSGYLINQKTTEPNTGNSYASYSLGISLDGISIWSSSLALNSAGTITSSGQDIGATYSDDASLEGSEESFYKRHSLTWNNFQTSLDLGQFASGESKQLIYSAKVSTYSYEEIGGGSYQDAWMSSASLSDPFSSNFVVDFTPTNTVDVPEPSSFALLALGLVGLVRIRKQKPTL